MGKRNANKNPPFFSHEFVIQNHADIVSCVAMVFVVGLMVQVTNPIASVFIALNHNVTGAIPTQENPRGEPFLYEPGVKDLCAVFFYTLISIILHAILQEYGLDKMSKKMHLSKFKLSKFNESGQLVVFYAMSFFWGMNVIGREGYIANFSQLWTGFPDHPMSFLNKLFFIIQMGYYWHMLPELYFQKIKKEEQQPKILHAICGFLAIAMAYFMHFHRIALVLLTLHYFSEIISHAFQLFGIFDREEKYSSWHIFNRIVFVLTRFATVVIAVLTLYYGIEKTTGAKSGLLALVGVIMLQGYLIFQFISDMLRTKREKLAESQSTKKVKSAAKSEKSKKERKRESDLPEADQNSQQKKIK